MYVVCTVPVNKLSEMPIVTFCTIVTVAVTLQTEEEGVNTPNAHVTEDGVSYPEGHDGWQLLPLVSHVGQLPIDPLFGAATAQGSGRHATGCPAVVVIDPIGGRGIVAIDPS